MDIKSFGSAAQAYASARPATRPDANEGGFARMARELTETIGSGESAARAAVVGDADPHALVQALAQSELAVETAVTVRDKVVEAYQEILRMPV